MQSHATTLRRHRGAGVDAVSGGTPAGYPEADEEAPEGGSGCWRKSRPAAPEADEDRRRLGRLQRVKTTGLTVIFLLPHVGLPFGWRYLHQNGWILQVVTPRAQQAPPPSCPPEPSSASTPLPRHRVASAAVEFDSTVTRTRTLS